MDEVVDEVVGEVMNEREPRRRPEPLIDLSTPHRFHLVGVGGPGMAPLARLLTAAGQIVSGSDVSESSAVIDLRTDGITVSVGHDASLVTGVDCVVYSTAVPSDNIELEAARQTGVRVCHRAVALASLCHRAMSVGVAGAHGKTTTSALLTQMLRATGENVQAYIGADVKEPTGVGSSVGSRVEKLAAETTLVVEADESDGTIEVLPLDAIAVTNIDRDHLDYWGDMSGIVDGFTEVVRSVVARSGGPVILNADDPSTPALLSAIASTMPAATVRQFGWAANCDVRIIDARATTDGLAVSLQVDGRSVDCALPLRGAHNAANLACAVAMATALGVDANIATRAAESFAGVERRFSERGLFNGAVVIDDYAHLPAEISASIAAARELPQLSGRVVAVFQPNRFHRVAAMADDYAGCFDGADHVVITDIYASGTSPIEGVTGKRVADAVAGEHDSVVWAQSRDDVVTELRNVLKQGDVCLGMGCGDISTLASDLGVESS